MNFKSPPRYFPTLGVEVHVCEVLISWVSAGFDIVDPRWDRLDPTLDIYELPIAVNIFPCKAVPCNSVDIESEIVQYSADIER